MKVFEVVIESCKKDSKEIVTSVQYVTSEKDNILAVTKYFTEHCEQYKEDLKSVKEVLIIVQHLKS